MNIRLRFKKDVTGLYGTQYKKDSEKVYKPWDFNWQGMTEPERVSKGIFVECGGHGEFDVFKREDVYSIIDCKAE